MWIKQSYMWNVWNPYVPHVQFVKSTRSHQKVSYQLLPVNHPLLIDFLTIFLINIHNRSPPRSDEVEVVWNLIRREKIPHLRT